MKSIESMQNPTIKSLIKLKKSRERKNTGLILVEGERELNMAIKGGLKIDSLFICPDFQKEHGTEIKQIGSINTFTVAPKIFSRISLRENPDGWLAILRPQEKKLADIILAPLPLVIIIESVEKPGNLGAILRTADAAAVDAVLIADQRTDIYNPNVIRASQGTVFTLPIAVENTGEILAWTKKNNLRLFAAAPSAEKLYTEADYSHPAGIVMGTEDKGLSKLWLDAAEKIRIPMHGKIDSLNVSVSTAIIVYEALRQRSKIRIEK